MALLAHRSFLILTSIADHIFFRWIHCDVLFNTIIHIVWSGLAAEFEEPPAITQTAWEFCKDLQWLIVFNFHLTVSGNIPTTHRYFLQYRD